MAIAAKHMAARFARGDAGLFDHRIFGICGDGDMMEGVASEAASIAGHLGLGNVIYLYDDNHVTIDGAHRDRFHEDVVKRFDAYGWHTQDVEDANDLAAVVSGDRKWNRGDQPAFADSRAQPYRLRQPAQAGHFGGARQCARRRRGQADQGIYKWPPSRRFLRAATTRSREFRKCVERGAGLRVGMESAVRSLRQGKSRTDASGVQRGLARELPAGWDKEMPVFTPKDALATRESASAVPERRSRRRCGTCSAAPPTSTNRRSRTSRTAASFERGHYDGRNLHFGIREHGMCSILNGIALHGGFIPYGSSFHVLHRLLPAVDTARGADGTAGDFRFHA